MSASIPSIRHLAKTQSPLLLDYGDLSPLAHPDIVPVAVSRRKISWWNLLLHIRRIWLIIEKDWCA